MDRSAREPQPSVPPESSRRRFMKRMRLAARAPRFTERDQHAILTALAGAFDEGAQRDSIKAMQAVLTNPRTVLKALELLARLNGELDSPHRMSPLKRPGPRVASPTLTRSLSK